MNGNGTYTTPTGYMLSTTGTVIGTYQWNASYSGDGNNDTVIDNNDPSELVKVNAWSPTIGSISVGGEGGDGGGVCRGLIWQLSAVLSGYFPTGTITFTLYSGTTQITEGTTTVSVSGDGTYETSVNTAWPTQNLGSSVPYQWDVSYSGDGNNYFITDDNDSSGSGYVYCL